jgi:hypothetical protein
MTASKLMRACCKKELNPRGKRLHCLPFRGQDRYEANAAERERLLLEATKQALRSIQSSSKANSQKGALRLGRMQQRAGVFHYGVSIRKINGSLTFGKEMLRLAKTASVVVVLCAPPSTARAETVTVADDWSLTIDKPIEQIIYNHRLNKQQAGLAKRAAAGFAYVGMCRRAGFSGETGAVSLIMQANPEVPYQAAALAILGIYTRSSFGRQNSAVCARVYDDATKQQ